MRLPARFTRWLADRLIWRAMARPADFIIGNPAEPYLLRWWLVPRNRWLNVYLHHFQRSDDPRAMHDHPWVNLSLVLRGEYLERMPGRDVVRRAGEMVGRRATAAHRIELTSAPAWSLFLTGPITRRWGFHCPKGWRHWKLFVSGTSIDARGQVGRGCD